MAISLYHFDIVCFEIISHRSQHKIVCRLWLLEPGYLEPVGNTEIRADAFWRQQIFTRNIA